MTGELTPSAHWSSAVLLAFGVAEPGALDELEAVLAHFTADHFTADTDHPSPTCAACRAAVDAFGAAHPISVLLAALYSAVLVQAGGKEVCVH